MLAKEKRFAVRSIAVGIVATGLVAGFCSWQVLRADARLYELQQKPPALPKPPPNVVFDKPAAPPKVLHDGDFVPDSDLPDPLEGATRVSPEIDQAETDLNQARDSRWFLSLATFIAFCLPLAWYFLLDRLREISGALSGRDKSDSR